MFCTATRDEHCISDHSAAWGWERTKEPQGRNPPEPHSPTPARPGPTPPLSPIRRPPVGRAEGARQCARRQLDVHCEGLHGEAGTAGPSPAAGGLPTTARLAATATQEAAPAPANGGEPVLGPSRSLGLCGAACCGRRVGGGLAESWEFALW